MPRLRPRHVNIAGLPRPKRLVEESAEWSQKRLKFRVKTTHCSIAESGGSSALVSEERPGLDPLGFQICPSPCPRLRLNDRFNRCATKPRAIQLKPGLVGFPSVVCIQIPMLKQAAAACHEVRAGRFHAFFGRPQDLHRHGKNALTPVCLRLDNYPFTRKSIGDEDRSVSGFPTDFNVRICDLVAAPTHMIDGQFHRWLVRRNMALLHGRRAMPSRPAIGRYHACFVTLGAVPLLRNRRGH